MKPLLLLSLIMLSSSPLLYSESCDPQKTCAFPDLINEGKKRIKQMKQTLDQQLHTIDPILRTATGLGALSLSLYLWGDLEKQSIKHTLNHFIEASSAVVWSTLFAVPFIVSGYLIYHGAVDLLNQSPRSNSDELDEQEEAELVALSNSRPALQPAE